MFSNTRALGVLLLALVALSVVVRYGMFGKSEPIKSEQAVKSSIILKSKKITLFPNEYIVCLDSIDNSDEISYVYGGCTKLDDPDTPEEVKRLAKQYLDKHSMPGMP